MVVALISAFLAGLFTVLNKKLVSHQKASVISFYEMMGGVVGIAIYLFISSWTKTTEIALPTFMDLVYLLILGIVCTGYAFAVTVDIMKHLSAYVVTLTINLEPVYGILMAYFIFGESEHMTGGFYLGTTIILLSVLGYPMYHYMKRKTM